MRFSFLGQVSRKIGKLAVEQCQTASEVALTLLGSTFLDELAGVRLQS
jgi:hypothetical protein